MKRLNELYDCKWDVPIYDIKINSKDVKDGDLFVCVKGVNCDRHDFIDEAIKNGASALIVTKGDSYPIPFIKVLDADIELKRVAKRFYDSPCDNIKLIGVTGTDGKTTTASIVRDLLGDDLCGYMGTNGVYLKDSHYNLSNTTPDGHIIYKYLDKMVKDGLKYASIETSSEAFYRNRLEGFSFDVGVLTNVTGDHLNIHKSRENYIACKMELFKKIKKCGYAVLNRDDCLYEDFLKVCNCNVITYGMSDADLVFSNINEYVNKTEFDLTYKGKCYRIVSGLVSSFNVYNLCASFGVLLSLGFDIEDIIGRVNRIVVPLGRCERLDFGCGYDIILDYAHTSNALLNILSFLKRVSKGRIITVTGSAGGREHEKRKEMGKVVLENSSLVIFTMDDPRGEDVNEIIDELISNNKGNYKRVIDRKDAIKMALSEARSGDTVLIAGKGRDNYMAIGNSYVPYCDYDVICDYFKKDKL